MLVDESLDVLDTLEEILVASGHKIIGKTSKRDKVIEIFLKTKPQLLLLDLTLLGEDSLSIIKKMTLKFPKTRIVVCVRNTDEKLVTGCLDAGAIGSIDNYQKTDGLVKMISEIIIT